MSSTDNYNVAPTSGGKEKKTSTVSRLLRTSTFGNESSSLTSSSSALGPRKESTGRRPLSAIFNTKKHLYQLDSNRSRSEDSPENSDR